MAKTSMVEFLGEQDGYNCGYCNSKQTSFSHGMWAYQLTPQDYQNLIDRGWRRSGSYCYKPRMKETCCPLYAIRCDAMNVKLSKSQKKTMKRMFNFLANDKGRNTPCTSVGEMSDFPECYPTPAKVPSISTSIEVDDDLLVEDKSLNAADETTAVAHVAAEKPTKVSQKLENSQLKDSNEEIMEFSISQEKNRGNYDPTRPPCRKAKEIRRERKKQKLLASGVAPEELDSVLKPTANSNFKTIEDWLNKPLPENPAHKLEFRLVPCFFECNLFSETFQESYSVYKKYQMAIHKDTPNECGETQYKGFLVKNPFHYVENVSHNIYGPYHYQYLLDGKIIAVGVLDILPFCISSVYFYYDPDYSFLSLGRYSALVEIALARKLQQRFPLLKYYYMGFYIYFCPKMKYKGENTPSYLLCPETYIFQPIEKCLPKLSVSKYQRLEEDASKKDADGYVSLDDIKVLADGKAMTYSMYQRYSKQINNREKFYLYASLVGKKCYKNMLVHMS